MDYTFFSRLRKKKSFLALLQRTLALGWPSLNFDLNRICNSWCRPFRWLPCRNEEPYIQAVSLTRIISFHEWLSVLPSASLMVWVYISAHGNIWPPSLPNTHSFQSEDITRGDLHLTLVKRFIMENYFKDTWSILQ